ncbi:MAG: HDIG domain-containing protein [Spirochaetes bacterium]|nr:HDIG domain-containing protein [Spirochaetota bacterium]
MRNRTLRLPTLIGSAFQTLRLQKWTAFAVGAAFLAALGVIVASTQLPSISLRANPSQYGAGTVAQKDFVVDRDFSYVDEKATALKRETRERLVSPVFALNEAVEADALQRYARFAETLARLAGQGASVERILLRIQIDYPGRVADDDLRELLAFRPMARPLEGTRLLLEELLARGIVDVASHREEALAAGAIELWRSRDGQVQKEEVPFDAVVTLENAPVQVRGRAEQLAREEKEKRIISVLTAAFSVENAWYDPENTIVQRSRARAEVEPVTEKLAKGQVLARRGDIVSEATALKIRALSEYSKTVDLNGVVGSALFLLAVFAIGLYLIAMPSPAAPIRRNQVLLILGMGLAHVVLAALAVRLLPLRELIPPSVIIPTSSLSMLVAILVSTPVGVSFTLVVSLATLLLSGMSVNSFLFAFLSGIAGTAVVLGAERRIDLVRAGLILALIDAGILSVQGLLANLEPARFLAAIGWGFANGFLCGTLTLGFLPIFEYLLNAPTRFKLMELSDLNSPIFKRMLSQAPGTYTHSISVANLAETACEAIGANALLARVSAYYHDIGKVDQADYFIENQKAYNRHDEMKPSLSVAVIKSHVRIGIEKARELKLPQAIVDIIAQHHGRGLITYFYHRAMNEGKNPRVSRDDYSYPGVRPRTREAAVLMLADAVEAATRSLKRPTESRLERDVQDIIMDKFTTGELGDSGLTLRDLESIRRSFAHILEGYFHTRIEYPKLRKAKEVPQ